MASDMVLLSGLLERAYLDKLVPQRSSCEPGTTLIAQIINRERLVHNQDRDVFWQELLRSMNLSDTQKDDMCVLFASFCEERTPVWQNRLAREAICDIAIEEFTFPSISIIGTIFRHCEFERPGSAIWNMWTQMLAGACRKELGHKYHPAFSSILAQISNGEAKLLTIVEQHRQEYGIIAKTRGKAAMLQAVSQELEAKLENSSIQSLIFYVDHLEALGLFYFLGYQPGEDEKVFYVLSNEYMDGHVAFTGIGLMFLQFTLPSKR